LSTLRVEVPRKLVPLLQPKRYKGAYGGRGGAKSHFFAEQIILRCYNRTTRVVCIREVQNSIKDSVKQLLTDKIAKLGLNHAFEVIDNEIRCNNGSLIIFRGMQSYNADNIKSLEAYDLAWVEEAQTLSQHSLDLLRPTLRAEGSELWFSWNPRYKTDAVDKFFRKNPPEDSICVQINWRDNPWFPDVLRKEMLHDFMVDEDKAEHIWNGAYGAGQGAILARYVNRAERDGRINNEVVFDKDGAQIEVSSDLGFRDTASWWYWQRKPGGFALLMYDGDSGLDADDWIERIQNNITAISGGKLGKIWLPHDARAKTFQSKHTVVDKFLSNFGAGKVAVVPQTKKTDQINAARAVIANCEFHKERCEDGLDGLMAWEYEYDEENGVFSREPKHNWASHPSDAFAYGCQVMQDVKYEVTTEPVFPVIAKSDNTIQLPPLDDMWAQASKHQNRRI
jgi:phage terminase large subunit